MNYRLKHFFNQNNLYHQWLVRRSAQPFRTNVIITKVLWGAYFVFLVTYQMNQNIYSFWLNYIFVISGFLLVVIPILFTFTNFLYYTPLAIQDDSRSSMLDFIFCSPIRTGEIVSNLRRFIAVQNLKLWMPTIVWALSMFLIESTIHGFPHFYSISDTTGFFTLLIMPPLLWWMLLETGVAAAALPKYATRTGLIFMLWVIPALLVIFVGSYYAAQEFLELFSNFGIYSPAFSRCIRIPMWELESVMYELTMLTLTLFFALIPFFSSKNLMTLRRSGRWT